MSDAEPQFILLFGGPAAGKGTQAHLLSQALGIPHVSSGELLRENGSQFADNVMRRGDLLPDDVVSQLVFDRLQQPDARQGAVLDGYPRNLSQAESLDRWLADHGATVSAAIYLDVPPEEMVRRLVERGEISGRSDDRPQTAERRLEVFKQEMPPVLEHYARRGLFRKVDGTGSIKDVHQRVADVLNTRPIA